MRIKGVCRNIKAVFKILRKDYKYIYLLIFLKSFLEAVIPYVNLIFSAIIINKLILKKGMEAFYGGIFMMILNLCLNIIISACKKSMDTIKDMCQDNLEKQCVEKMFNIRFEKFQSKDTMNVLLQTEISVITSGGTSSVIKNFINMVENGFRFIFGILCMGSLLFISSSSVILIFIAYVLILSVCYGILYRYYNTIICCAESVEESNRNGTKFMNETTEKEKDMYIRIYKMQGYYEEKFSSIINNFKKMSSSMRNVYGSMSSISDILAKISSIMIYVYTGIRALLGHMRLGYVIMYGGAIYETTHAFYNFLLALGETAYITGILERYAELINRNDMETQGSIPIEKRNDYNYEFQFQNVGFHYPGENTMILKDINLKFKIGEKLAVVGLNGAGKTTLIKLLCRLYEPTEGVILLNGIDINKYDFNEYVSLFSVVFQDFQLFSLDLYENVSGDSSPDIEKVKQCLKKVGMEHIKNTRLNNDNGQGINLSQGEQQKIAIARALYKDAAFVILDEPTASLDPLAEAEVYENFDTLVENKSAIYISHRMSSCKFCNSIVVLEGGRITERGNHDELMKLNGKYATMFNTQAEYYRENIGRDCFGN